MARHLLELLTQLKPNRALFTTYTFNPSFFDAALMPALANRDGCDIAVLADARQLAESSIGSYSSQVGIEYVVAPVTAPGGGIFHPKLAYLESQGEAYLCVGSSNLTVAGQCLQLECWDVIALAEARGAHWQFIEFIDELGRSLQSSSARASAILQKLTRRLKVVHPPVTPSAQEPRLIHTLNVSAQQQLIEEFGRRQQFCEALTVFSPFHSEAGRPVKRLASLVSAKSVRVAHDGVGRFDKDAFSTSKFTLVHPVMKGRQVDAGRSHAKVFELAGEDESLVMAGSVNATATSFETLRNVEVAVMRWSSESPFRWAKAKPQMYAPTESPQAEDTQLLVEAALKVGVVVDGIAKCTEEGWLARKATWTLYEGERALESGRCGFADGGHFTFHLGNKVPAQHASLTLQLKLGSLVGRGWVNDEQALYEAATGVRANAQLARAMSGVGDEDSIAYVISMLARATGPADHGAAVGPRLGSPATAGHSAQENDDEDDAPFSYEDWLASGGLRRRRNAQLANAQNLLKAVYALLFPVAPEAQNSPTASAESTIKLAGTDSEEEDSRGGSSASTRHAPAVQPSSAGTRSLPPALERRLQQALVEVQIAFESCLPLRGAPFLVKAVSAMELSKLQERWRVKTPPAVEWDYQKSFLLWMDRLCNYPFEDEARAALLPVVAALACFASRRVLSADSERNPFGRLPVLRSFLERFACRTLSKDEVEQQASLGLDDELFARLDPALRAEAKACAVLLACSPRLDDALLSAIEDCVAGREPDPQAKLSFPAIQRVLAGGRRANGIAKVLDRGTLSLRGCPICGLHLEDDEVAQLKYTRAIQHPQGRRASEAHLLVYPDDALLMSGLLAEVPPFG